MTPAIALVAITMYIPRGPVTFCGQQVADIAVPWVAMPYSQHGITWECGDRVGVMIDGQVRVYTALDTGPFGAYCVRQLDGTCPPIAADIPQQHKPFPGLSAVGRVWVIRSKRAGGRR